MATYKGLVIPKGKIGDQRFYTLKGQKGHFVGMKGGASKATIMTAPEFARTRENMTEFGGMSMYAKGMSIILAIALTFASTNKKWARNVVKVIKEMMILAGGVRGQRPISLSTMRDMVVGIDLNVNSKFDESMRADYVVTPSGTRNACTVQLGDLNSNSIIAPVGATHYEITAVMGALKDATFEILTNAYAFVGANVIATVKETTGVLPLDTPVIAPAALAPIFAGSPSMVTNDNVFVALTITFYQQIDAVNYRMYQKDAGRIIACF